MKKTKQLFSLLAAVVLLISGFGCKGLSAEEQAAIKPVTLKYWTITNDIGILEQMAEEYKKMRPYVTVDIRKVGYEEFDTLLLNALADDVSPDIISVNVKDIRKYLNRLADMPASVKVADVQVKGKYAKETIVTPIEVKMPTPAAIKSNFITTVYEDAIVNGQIIGLPLSVDTLALYYNKELLDQANIPEPPQTWEDFMEAVKATTKFDAQGNVVQSGVALGTGNNIPRAFDLLSLFMLQSGVKMTEGNRVAFTAGLDKPQENNATLAALRFYTDFAQPTKEVYCWNESNEDALQAFARGKLTFYFGFSYDYQRIKARAPQMDVEILPIPQLNSSAPVNIANYWVETVSRKSKNANEAWDFIKFITSKENIKKYTEAVRQPSPVRSQVEEQRQDLVLAPFTEYLLQSKNWYRGRDSVAAEKAIKDMLHSYLQPFGGTDKKKLDRDAALVKYAAQLIQQTL